MKDALIKLSANGGGGITRSTVDTILQIHRGKDGFIGFGIKTEDGWDDIVSLPIQKVREDLPAIADFFLQDAYITVNSPYRAAPYNNSKTGLPAVWRKEKDMRWLNACYLDIDVGREDSLIPAKRLTWGDAIGAAVNMADRGEILQPSMFARSGRGIYLLWLLVENHESNHPPSAYKRQISLYKQINELLGAVFEEHLGEAVDRIAKDASRYLRMPGSVHSKTGVTASYYLALDSKSRPFYYTMDELANFLKLQVNKAQLPRDTKRLLYDPSIYEDDNKQVRLRFTVPDKRGTVPNRKKGYLRRWAMVSNDILNLSQYYGGWKQGSRWNKLGIYARFLWYAGAEKDRIIEAVTAMAGDCQPPYPSDPMDVKVSYLVNAIMKTDKRIWNRERLVRSFGVTAEIARKAELDYILPKEVLAEREAGKVSRQDVIKDRREKIKSLMARKRGIPTNKQITGLLNCFGFDVSASTVSRDIKAILKEFGRA